MKVRISSVLHHLNQTAKKGAGDFDPDIGDELILDGVRYVYDYVDDTNGTRWFIDGIAEAA